MTLLRAGSATDVGRVRTSNQDLALTTATLFAVADGMGGHVGGEVASRLAIDALEQAFSRQPTTSGLVDAVAAANDAVWEQSHARSDLRGMGTTLVALGLVQDEDGSDVLTLVNVGDSRAYVLHQGALTQVTADHSVSEELLRKGELTRAEADVHPQRHILTRALGVLPRVEPDAWHLRLSTGDRMLLCTDGLTNELDEEQIAAVLRTEPDPDRAAATLVQRALDHGGNDNVTIVVVDVLLGEDRDPEPATAAEGDGPVDADVLLSPQHGATEAPVGPSAPSSATEPEPSGLQVGLTGVAGHPAAQPSGQLIRFLTRRPPRAARPPRSSRAGTRRGFLAAAAFLVLLCAVFSGAYAAVRWYALDSYYVGLRGDELDIFQGRPGGVLWFQPALVRRTGVTTADVQSFHLSDLRAGYQESSYVNAEEYVERLVQETVSLGQGSAAHPVTTEPASSAASSAPPDGASP